MPAYPNIDLNMISPSSSQPPDYDLACRPKLERQVKNLRLSHTINIKPEGPNYEYGPASSHEDNGSQWITINNFYLRNDIPQNIQDDYPDDRLVIVLFHEVGHFEYFDSTPIDQRSDEDSEFMIISFILK